MRIAVDVTPLLPGGVNGGVKQHVTSLLDGFLTLSSSVELLLLVNSCNPVEFRHYEDRYPNRCRLSNPQGSSSKILKLAANRLSPKRPRFKKWRPDILFCPLTAPTYAYKGLTTVCTVNDIQHIYHPEFFTEKELKTRHDTYRKVIAKANHIVCISEFTKKTFLTKFVFADENVSVIPIDATTRLSGRPQGELAGEKPFHITTKEFFLYPANFWPHKNHHRLLEAFSIFLQQNENPDCGLVLTGEGLELENELRERAGHLKIDNKVYFPGFVGDNTLAKIWFDSLGLVYPSLFEGFGIPLLESMAFKKPIAASFACSIPEVAGDAAIYFDPLKPVEIANCLTTLYRDPNKKHQLVANGQKQLLNFSIRDITRSYLDLFQMLIDGKQGC